MVTPLGSGVKATWNNLLEGRSGIRALTLEDLKMNTFNKETQLNTFDQLTSKVAATVPSGTNPGEFNDEIWLNSKVNGRPGLGFRVFVMFDLCPMFIIYFFMSFKLF